MPPYSFISTGRLFDLVLPKPVIDICSKGNPGDCSLFHFVESMDTVFSSKSKPTLSVTNLEDGSWNITNKKDIQPNSDLTVKNVYFIVTTENSENQDQSVTQAEPSDVKPIENDMEVDDAEGVQEEPAEFQDQTSAGEPFKEEWTDDKEDERGDPDPPEDKHVHPLEHFNPEGHPHGHSSERQVLPDPGEQSVGSQAQDTGEASQTDPNVLDHDYSGATDDDMSSEEELFENSLEAEAADDAERNVAVPKPGVHCSICPSIIKDNWNLLKHIKRYHQEHPTYWALVAQIKPQLRVRCELCGKVFGNQKILVEHEQKVHHTSIGATCAHCGKFFKTQQHMRIHVKYMHLRQPGTYLCDLCPSKFNTKNVLREHIKYSHSTVDRSNKCTECDFVYAFKKQFYEHFTRVHAPKKHTCPYCDYKCATKWYMKKHTKNCAPKTYHMSQNEANNESTQASQGNLAQQSVDLSQVLRQVQQIEERSTDGLQVQQLEDDGTSLRTWQVMEEPEESNQAEYDSLHAGQVKIGDQNNQSVGLLEVGGEKRQRISLTAADGSQQTIELILPK